jgi:hypothetical protein
MSKRGRSPTSAAEAAKIWSSSLESCRGSSPTSRLRRFEGHPPPTHVMACHPKPRSGEGWWSQPGSNRRPQACKASALPTELWPHSPPKVDEVYGCHPLRTRSADAPMVGRGGVEPPTSRLSGVRSNHLSYRPPSYVSLKRRRSHPRAWLSSHKLGRAFALAALTGRLACSG